jgi:nanoRNase/pAp phosphatase (c-di-AMP/oligoRNAs hydrolase)
MSKQTVILYHADCPDGFGGAYAAWKKFGDTVEYLPVDAGVPPKEDLSGKDLYLIDVCFNAVAMQDLLSKARKLVVLDHHEGVRQITESIPEHVYDANRSGATIAWSYFHPDTPVPELLRYVEDGDLYRFVLPDSRPILAYCYAQPFTFASWDALVTQMGDDTEKANIVARGLIYEEYRQILAKQIADKAWLVSFEGLEVLAVDAPRFLVSDVGHLLAERKAPLALVVRAKRDGLRISLRGDGSINVATIAQKYGGNGHPNSAAFGVPLGAIPPFTTIHHHAHPRD